MTNKKYKLTKTEIKSWKLNFEIINEISEYMPYGRINNKVIYFCDVEINIFKEVVRSKNKRKYKVKTERKVILKDEIWTSNASKQTNNFFMNQLKHKIDLTESERFEIKSIKLKKELGCSFNKN